MRRTTGHKRALIIICCLSYVALGLSQAGCHLIDTVVPLHANVGDRVALRDHEGFLPLEADLYAMFGTEISSTVLIHDKEQIVVTVPDSVEGETLISIWSGDTLIDTPVPFLVDTVPLEVRILAYGDSLVADAFHSQILDDLLNDRVSPSLVINEGKSGETLQQGALRLETVLSIHKGVEYIYILEGANNVTDYRNTPVEEMLVSLGWIIGLARTAKITPVLMTLPPRTRAALMDDQTSPTTEEWNEALRTYAATNNLRLVDLYEAFLSEPDWGSLLAEDGLHMTTTGSQLIAQKLYDTFLPSLAPE